MAARPIGSTIFYVLLIGISLFFMLGLIGIGIAAGVFVILGIDIALIIMKEVLLKKGGKEKIKSAGSSLRNSVEVVGTIGQEVAKTAAVAAVESGKIVSAGIKSTYDAMGGSEGVQKAVGTLGKATAEVGKAATAVAIEAGNVITDVARDAAKQMQANRRARESRENRERLEDLGEKVIYNIISDDD